MKRRSLTVLLCLLAIISLASVGFASWVISADDTEVVEGNIQVETVTDQRLDVVVAEGQNKNINLLAPATQEIPNSWLKGNGESEKLEVVIDFTVKYKDSDNKNTPTAKVTWTWDEATRTLLDEAIAAQYITEPTVIITNRGNCNYSLTIKFAWGDAFKLDGVNVNPYTYYNTGKTANGFVNGVDGDSWADHAIDTLTALNTMFTSKTYKGTIKAVFAETADPAVTPAE